MNHKHIFLDESTVGVDNLSEEAVCRVSSVAEGLFGTFFPSMLTFVWRPHEP